MGATISSLIDDSTLEEPPGGGVDKALRVAFSAEALRWRPAAAQSVVPIKAAALLHVLAVALTAAGPAVLWYDTGLIHASGISVTRDAVGASPAVTYASGGLSGACIVYVGTAFAFISAALATVIGWRLQQLLRHGVLPPAPAPRAAPLVVAVVGAAAPSLQAVDGSVAEVDDDSLLAEACTALSGCCCAGCFASMPALQGVAWTGYVVMQVGLFALSMGLVWPFDVTYGTGARRYGGIVTSVGLACQLIGAITVSVLSCRLRGMPGVGEGRCCAVAPAAAGGSGDGKQLSGGAHSVGSSASSASPLHDSVAVTSPLAGAAKQHHHHHGGSRGAKAAGAGADGAWPGYAFPVDKGATAISSSPPAAKSPRLTSPRVAGSSTTASPPPSSAASTGSAPGAPIQPPQARPEKGAEA